MKTPSATNSERRRFIKQSATLGLLPFLGAGLAACSIRPKARVVVVGGGFGGATCARYLRKLDPSIEVTLIEASARYVSCPFSNTVFADMHKMAELEFGYAGLQSQFGVQVRQAHVENIDAEKRHLRLSDQTTLAYDKLILSPGVQFRWGSPEGYDQAASEHMPHAWKAGAQTVLLDAQLKAMNNGGVVAISIPPKPFRCPPGPYERASLIASYLKRHKPRSKILILDGNDGFAKQSLFEEAWASRYAGMIEWVPVSEGGSVYRVDAKTRQLFTDLETFKPDVANVIPAQIAASLAVDNGLANTSGWCPVDQQNFASTLLPDVHILGDACLAGQMPKSASSANSQAKVCALAVVAELNGLEAGNPSFHNTCYSLVDSDYGISVNAIYGLQDGKITKVESSGGVSPLGASPRHRADEARYAKGWFDSITADSFAV